MLPATDGVARFRSGIDAVKQSRLRLEIKTQSLEVFVPVWEFDHYLHIGIDCFRRVDHQFLCSFSHELQTVLGPGQIPLGLDAQFAFAIGEEKVIEDNFVEMSRRILCDFLHPFPVFGVRVAKCLITVTLVDRIGDPSRNFDASCLKKFLG